MYVRFLKDFYGYIGGSGGFFQGGDMALSFTSFTLPSTTAVTQAWSDTAGGAMAQVGSAQVSVTTTRVNEVIVIGFIGVGAFGAGADLVLGYQIGAATAVNASYANGGGTFNMSFTKPATVASPGTYTVKLVASKSTGSPNIEKGNHTDATLFVVQQA